MQRSKRRAVVCVLLAVVLIIAMGVFGYFYCAGKMPREQDLVQDFVEYARMHDELTFGDITEFEWDIAIRDSAFYASGKLVMEGYGYEYEPQRMLDDGERRWIFFKDGVMVYACTYVAGSGFNFAGDRYTTETVLKSFTPDTVFRVQWEDNRSYPVLYLAAPEPPPDDI